MNGRAEPRNAVGVHEWVRLDQALAARDRVLQQQAQEAGARMMRRVDFDGFVEDEADRQPIPEPVDREEE